MTEEPKKEGDFESEFRRLGENLKNSFQSAWDSPSSQSLQDDIKSGFNQLSETLNEIITGFAESPTGQKLQEGVDDFGAQLQSGEVEAKVREELLSVLDTVNAELEKISSNLAAKSQDDGEA